MTLETYDKRPFTASITDPGTTDPAQAAGRPVTHDIYSKGTAGATVVIIQELPGIGKETISLAETFVEQGFRVVLPHLFGPLGRISLLGNTARVFCMRREFKLFEKNQSSPVVDWLKALCADLRAAPGTTGVGVIGMCLTGNFAISLMADDNVLAGVASQPSMPLFNNEALHMSADEISGARARLDEHGPMLALRFTGDKLCTGEKFAALARTFNDDKERIKLVELPGNGHSVLTLDLIKGGEPAQQALDEVLSYFNAKLN
ncbi:MAG: dienelactone hydrolase family protein [Pseudomonadota bacterium]